MPSTYTTNGGIEKIATGEQSGSWGDTTNLNFDILDRITNGVGSIALSGTSSNLQTADGSLSDGQFKAIVLTGSPSGTHTITVLPNDAQKIYYVVNSSGQSVIFDQGSGDNVTIANGQTKVIYCDGGGASAAVVDLSVTNANNLSDLGDNSVARTNLGVAIGVDVQAFDAQLNAIAGLSQVATETIVSNGSTYISTGAATTALQMPAGTTAQRPSPAEGMIRYNSDEAEFEGYADGAWGRIAGGAAGGAQTITTTSTAQSTLATYSATDYVALEVLLAANDGTDRTITKMLIAHDGSTAVATQYGEVNTGAQLATYDVDVSGGNVRVLVTAASATSTDHTAIATAVDA